MARIYAIANEKGGSGKTTSTLALGSALADKGLSVLMVDLDAQGSLSLSCGLDMNALDGTVYEVLAAVLRDEARPSMADVTTHIRARLDLIPCDIRASQLDVDLVRDAAAGLVLREPLRAAADSYDIVLLDCPPNLGLVVINALAACDAVIVPMKLDYLSLKGLDLILDSVARVKKRLNRTLDVAGVLYTFSDARTSHTRQIRTQADVYLDARGIRRFKAEIRTSTLAREAPAAGQSVTDYMPSAGIAKDYKQVAEELLA